MGTRLLVGMAAVAMLSACSGQTPDVDDDAASPAAASADPADVPACPRWDAEPTYPEGDLPAGALSIRVCPGEKSVRGPRVWKPAVLAPVDALTEGVEEVVDDLNGLPDWEGLPEGTFCSQEGRPRVHYVVGYPDGTPVGHLRVRRVSPARAGPTGNVPLRGDARQG